jgi:type IV pilus assembly protein PilO
MPELRDTRHKLKIAIAAMLIVDVAAAAVLFSPLVGSERSRREQLAQLWQELRLKTKQVEPLRGLDKKIVTADRQINDFYKDRIAEHDSDISVELGKLASQSGVVFSEVKYKLHDPEPVGLRRVEIDADLSGDYLHLVRFINALERDHIFFIIDSVGLGGEQGGVVKLQMKVETYLKVEA